MEIITFDCAPLFIISNVASFVLYPSSKMTPDAKIAICSSVTRPSTIATYVFTTFRLGDVNAWFTFPSFVSSNNPSVSLRSEERRVGKECRYRWWREQERRTVNRHYHY